MKYDKFFKLAKEAGIEEAELYVSDKVNLSFSLFHGEVDSYENNSATNIVARGIVNGKFGQATCDTWNNEKCAFLVKEIKENALVIENEDPAIIFAGSEKYKKVNTYNKELKNVPVEKKFELAKELEKAIRAADQRVVEVAQVGYEEQEVVVTLINSKGLKLSSKTNYCALYGVAVASNGQQVKTEFDLTLTNKFEDINVNELAKKVAKKACDQLGGEPCDSGKYKAVLSPDVVNALMQAYVNYASSEEVQKQSSLFIGKLGQKIASKKVTILDKPLEKNIFARWFDDEGVATSNKEIIKNGVLQTYLYNLTTAAKENRTSTGNGFKEGAAMGVSSSFLYLKPGKKTQDELFAEVKDGVYITSVTGLHAGLNAQSGNFSLQSSGFLIKDGKLDRGLDIITVSGNLMDVFNDVLEVGSDSTLQMSGAQTSSILIKKLAVSGK